VTPRCPSCGDILGPEEPLVGGSMARTCEGCGQVWISGRKAE
jgi:hypothetical protein